jgi:uncharacterized protein involved in exopolysaccharide biosynthesis
MNDPDSERGRRDETLDVRTALRLLLRKRWWIIASVVL